jgi:hypothetical protein
MTSISLAAILLGLAYLPAGRWWILAVLGAMVLFWLVMKRWSIFGSASALLLIYLLVAAVGVLTGLSLSWLVAGCTFALASWDLVLFSEALQPGPPARLTDLMERSHLRSLAAACGAGLSLGLLAAVIHFELPFIVVVLLVLLAVGGLVWGLRSLEKWTRAGRNGSPEIH